MNSSHLSWLQKQLAIPMSVIPEDAIIFGVWMFAPLVIGYVLAKYCCRPPAALRPVENTDLMEVVALLKHLEWMFFTEDGTREEREQALPELSDQLRTVLARYHRIGSESSHES